MAPIALSLELCCCEHVRTHNTLSRLVAKARYDVAQLYSSALGRLRKARSTSSSSVVQLPSRQVTTWTPAQVGNIITSASSGNLTDAALFWSEIKRDDRVRGVLSTRTLGMLGLPLSWEGGDKPEGWNELAPDSELNKLLEWGLGLGVGLARVHDDGRLETWHMQWVRQDPITKQWYVTTESGERAIYPGLGGWILYTPYGDNEPWFEGLWTALAIPWLVKKYALHDRARASEVFGSAMVVGTAAEGASEDKRSKWLDDLKKLSRSSRLVLPEGYSLELLEAQGQTWGIYDTSVKWADQALTITVAGQIVTTEGQSGFSSGDIHQTIARSLVRFGAVSFAACLANQYVRPVWFSSAKPKWDVRAPSEAMDRANSLAAFGNAVTTANRALTEYGTIIDARQMADEASIPLKRKLPDDTSGAARLTLAPTDIARITTVNEARRSQGLADLRNPDGSPNPMGAMLIAELQQIMGVDEDNQPKEQVAASRFIAANRSVRGIRRCARSIDVSRAPSEFRIFKWGRTDSDKGPFTFTVRAALAITRQNSEVMIDLEHLAVQPDSKNYNPDAMGWARLELRKDGLWAVNCRWTDEGRKRIEKRKQRFISPAFYTNDKGEVDSLVNVALTALPAIYNQSPLIAAAKTEGTNMPPELLEALGLPDDASLVDVIGAIAEMQRLIASAAEDSGATETADAVDEAADAVEEAADAAEQETAEPETMADMPEDEDEDENAEGMKAAAKLIIGLSKRLDKLETKLSRDEKVELLNSISLKPGMRKWLASQPLDVVRSYVGANGGSRRSVRQPPSHQHSKKRNTSSITDDERKVIMMLNITEEEYLKEKQRGDKPLVLRRVK